MVFFSIIIPTYNRADIINDTIQSVINQSYTNWELIVIDDGGTDNTKDLINQINHPNISYYWKENGERGAARNFGVKKAKGEYIFFLDSDDLIYPKHLLQAKSKLIELKQPEFFHSRYEEIFIDKKVKSPYLDQNKIWQIIQKQNKFACQFFLRTDIALLHSFCENKELSVGEDWLLILEIGAKFNLNVSNNYTSAIVHHKERSMLMTSSDKIIKSKSIIIKQLQNNKLINSQIIKNVNAELTSLLSLTYSIEGSKKKAISHLIKATFLRPGIILDRRSLAIIKRLF